jgi:hypothetical protein
MLFSPCSKRPLALRIHFDLYAHDVVWTFLTNIKCGLFVYIFVAISPATGNVGVCLRKLCTFSIPPPPTFDVVFLIRVLL